MKRIAIIVETTREYGRELIKGIATYAQERRDWMMRSLASEDATPSRLANFDGIIARVVDEQLSQRLEKSGLPVIDVFCRCPRPAFAGVDADHEAIGRMAREFFVARNFVNLAFCGIPGDHYSDNREAGFSGKDVLVYRPFVPRPVYDSLFFTERFDRIPDVRDLRKWIKSLPTPVAVFCCNDLRAIHVQHIAQECGLRVPDDLAILGVDNDTIVCSFAEVPISSIDPNAFGIGYDAARLLDDTIARRRGSKNRRIHLIKPLTLVERASTEFQPVDPPWLREVLLHIERNLRQPLSASTIFTLAKRSKTRVEQVFREKLGRSVQNYVTQVKMREAKRLLANPTARVSEVAFACGYDSPAYFCRVFTSVVGTSPRNWRMRTDEKGNSRKQNLIQSAQTLL